MNAETIPEVNISAEDASEAAMALLYDHPELFWLDTAFSYQYTEDHVCTKLIMQFNDTADHIEETKKLFEENADAIINEALKCSGDYEKEKYVHDALLDMAGYDTEAAMNQSAFSALVSRTTVCAGYARAFQYIMLELGVPTYYCTGETQGHAWNIIKLDGGYYNVDVSRADTKSSPDRYFNRTDEDLRGTHKRSGYSTILPKCRAKTYEGMEE